MEANGNPRSLETLALSQDFFSFGATFAFFFVSRHEAPCMCSELTIEEVHTSGCARESAAPLARESRQIKHFHV